MKNGRKTGFSVSVRLTGRFLCTNGTCSDTNQCACDESAGYILVGKMRITNENKRLKNLNAKMRGRGRLIKVYSSI